jgi:hypothetical protein
VAHPHQPAPIAVGDALATKATTAATTHLPVVEKIDIYPAQQQQQHGTKDKNKMSALKHLKIAPKEAHKSTIIFLHVRIFYSGAVE